MQFSEYINQKNIKQEDAAIQLSTTQASICRWIKGENMPRPEQMRKITEWSGGEVTANDFYERTE